VRNDVTNNPSPTTISRKTPVSPICTYSLYSPMGDG